PEPKGPSGDDSAGSRGSTEKRSPSYTSIHGRTSARPRTVVDFAVPFSPRTRTPPISGLIAVRTRARPMSPRPEAVEGSYSQPRMAEKGYFVGTCEAPAR